jgi:hypothetical protein
MVKIVDYDVYLDMPDQSILNKQAFFLDIREGGDKKQTKLDLFYFNLLLLIIKFKCCD